jgi:hypothetical protein
MCRREILLRAFGHTSEDRVLHACCDIYVHGIVNACVIARKMIVHVQQNVHIMNTYLKWRSTY